MILQTPYASELSFLIYSISVNSYVASHDRLCEIYFHYRNTIMTLSHYLCNIRDFEAMFSHIIHMIICLKSHLIPPINTKFYGGGHMCNKAYLYLTKISFIKNTQKYSQYYGCIINIDELHNIKIRAKFPKSSFSNSS